MKRKIGILVCCLAFIGMFSVSALPAKALACRHDRLLFNSGGLVYEYHDDTYHYEVRRERWECGVCGYYEWVEGTDYTVNVGEHDFAGNTCRYCGHTR